MINWDNRHKGEQRGGDPSSRATQHECKVAETHGRSWPNDSDRMEAARLNQVFPRS